MPNEGHSVTLQSSQIGQAQPPAVAADSEVPRNQALEDNLSVAGAVSLTPASTAPTATVVPILPKDSPADVVSKSVAVRKETSEKSDGEPEPQQAPVTEELPGAKPPAPPVFKNWADVARGSAAAKSAAGAQSGANGASASTEISSGSQISGTTGTPQPQTRALVEVLRSYSVDAPEKITFIEPRGLYNSAVDCYINSVGPDVGIEN